MLGTDLSKISDDQLKLVTNSEIIAVNQDDLGIPGDQVWKEGPYEVRTHLAPKWCIIDVIDSHHYCIDILFISNLKTIFVMRHSHLWVLSLLSLQDLCNMHNYAASQSDFRSIQSWFRALRFMRDIFHQMASGRQSVILCVSQVPV